MYNFSASEGHSNGIKFGDLNALDAPTEYTLALWVKLLDLDLSAGVVLFDKYDAGGTTGWTLVVHTTEKLLLGHADGTLTTVGSDTALDGTVQSVVVTWDGGHAGFYLDGVADGWPVLTRAISANAIDVRIANRAGGTLGCPAYVGHVMWWDKALTAQESQMYHGGVIPQPGDLKFWAPGWTDPGIELIGQATAVKEGTVTIVEDTLTTVPYFFGQCGRFTLPYERIYKEYTEQADMTDEGLVGSPDFVNKLAVADSIKVEDHMEEGSGYIEPDGDLVETMSDGTVWTQRFPPFARKTTWTEG